jgi:hypothetical protein
VTLGELFLAAALFIEREGGGIGDAMNQLTKNRLLRYRAFQFLDALVGEYRTIGVAIGSMPINERQDVRVLFLCFAALAVRARR